MFTWELSLSELKSNRDLIQDKDSKQIPHLPKCFHLFPQLPSFHLLQDHNGCCLLLNTIFLIWKNHQLTVMQDTPFPFFFFSIKSQSSKKSHEVSTKGISRFQLATRSISVLPPVLISLEIVKIILNSHHLGNDFNLKSPQRGKA